MYYVLLAGGIAQQGIPNEDPDFPGVPIEDRYCGDFLGSCVQSPGPVEPGSVYDAGSGEFSQPPDTGEALIGEGAQGQQASLEVRVAALEDDLALVAGAVQQVADALDQIEQALGVGQPPVLPPGLS